MSDYYTIPFGGNSFCGTAVLAYIMRGTPDEAAKLLRTVSGQRSIKGVRPFVLIAAISKVGRFCTRFDGYITHRAGPEGHRQHCTGRLPQFRHRNHLVDAVSSVVHGIAREKWADASLQPSTWTSRNPHAPHTRVGCVGPDPVARRSLLCNA